MISIAWAGAFLTVVLGADAPDGECLALDPGPQVSLRFLGSWPPELERSVRSELELELGAAACERLDPGSVPLRIGWSPSTVQVRVGDAVSGKVRRIERASLPTRRLAFAVAVVVRELVRAEASPPPIAPRPAAQTSAPSEGPERRTAGVAASSGVLFVGSNPPAVSVNAAFHHRPTEAWSWSVGVMARRVGAQRGAADVTALEVGLGAGVDLRVLEWGPVDVRVGADVDLGAVFAEAERRGSSEGQMGAVSTAAGHLALETALGSDFALWFSARAGSYLVAPRIQVGSDEDALAFEGFMWGTSLGLTWLP